MMRYYSVTATAPEYISFLKHRVALGKGFNVFTILTDDIDRVVSDLVASGIKIHEVLALDGEEAFSEKPSSESELLAIPGDPEERKRTGD